MQKHQKPQIETTLRDLAKLAGKEGNRKITLNVRVSMSLSSWAIIVEGAAKNRWTIDDVVSFLADNEFSGHDLHNEWDWTESEKKAIAKSERTFNRQLKEDK